MKRGATEQDSIAFARSLGTRRLPVQIAVTCPSNLERKLGAAGVD
jgi:hypothetical protein